MTNPFKVGDIVRRKPNSNGSCFSYVEGTVERVLDGRIIIGGDKGQHRFSNTFELILSSTEEAVRLLTEAGFFVADSSSVNQKAVDLLVRDGYTVTPPPPKSNGTITIYRSQGEHRSIVALSSHEIARTGRLSSNYDVIAVVPWTEGDGL